jgi:nicotinamide mononucleotide (NMN) deamidase PncC
VGQPDIAFVSAVHKSVVLVDEELPIGLAANAVSVVGVSMGRALDGLVGPPLKSRDGHLYPGVVLAPLPILVAPQMELRTRYLRAADDPDMFVFPFSNSAQSCKTYDEYEVILSAADSADIALSAVGIVGPRKSVNKLAGSFPLLK